MLELRDVSVRYGKVQALAGVSVQVAPGTITSLIGANGAGKSTCLRAISGLAKLSSGEILYDGKRIHSLAPHRIARLGIAHVLEGKRLFSHMSVHKNLLAGAYLRRDRQAVESDIDAVYERFPVLGRNRMRAARTLSGGEQQMLAVSRAMMAAPRVYLFDEPSLGLAPLIVNLVAGEIKRLATEGAAVLLVEQNARLALKISGSAYVLETGRITMQGEANALANNDHIKEAYLGVA